MGPGGQRRDGQASRKRAGVVTLVRPLQQKYHSEHTFAISRPTGPENPAMDRKYLKHCLDQGLSLSEIGVLVNRDPSTVGYWVRKHGLVANGRAKHAPRGGLKREQLQPLVEKRLSLGQIADTLGVSVSTVRHWLKKHGLPTDLAYRRRKRRLMEAGSNRVRKVEMDCRNHGTATFVLDSRGSWRCLQCRADAVAARRRRVKQTLVNEAGGRCRLCGYNRHVAALHFHHLDPKEKTFSIAHDGITRSIDVMREEVKKCVLLCATCHAEVEAGVATLPAT